VIDGRQRVETIRAFLSNDFALSGLEYYELDRKRFNDLPMVLQKGLLRGVYLPSFYWQKHVESEPMALTFEACSLIV
jgi:hypothetical protein